MDTGMKKIYSLKPEIRATVAQMAEHLTRNEDVSGSIPDGGSSAINKLRPVWHPSNSRCHQIASISFKSSLIRYSA